jgi:acetyl esterase/lipase
VTPKGDIVAVEPNAQSELAQRLLQQLTAGLPVDVAEMRRMMLETEPLLNADPPKVGATHDEVLLREVDGARVTADVFVPDRAAPHPVLVFLHGGGWTAGSAKTHRKLALRFAEAGYLVVNVDYRLAPEAPFPGAFDDCVHAVRWAAENAARFGGDARRLAIGGDSAGANLAAAVAAHLADDARAPRIRAALLLYGAFDFERFQGLAAAAPPGPLADVARNLTRQITEFYLGPAPDAARLRDPRVSPVHAAAKLPPSFLVVGTADPLLEHQTALAAALADAGVVHENVIVDGMPHGFVQYEFLPQALDAIRRMAAFLDAHVG